MTDLLVTIPHTGTSYVMARRDVIQIHCLDPRLETDAAQAAPWVTTYRDPHLVAASWVNRYPIEEIEREWFKVWEYYADIVLPRATEILRVEDFTGPPMKITPEDRGAKKAYLDGDMDNYFSMVPKRLVQHALELTQDLRSST